MASRLGKPTKRTSETKKGPGQLAGRTTKRPPMVGRMTKRTGSR